jgi:hypothetical protein
MVGGRKRGEEREGRKERGGKRGEEREGRKER